MRRRRPRISRRDAESDLRRIDALMRRAAHPATPEEEARTSALIAIKLIDRAGFKIVDPRTVEPAPPPPPPPPPRPEPSYGSSYGSAYGETYSAYPRRRRRRRAAPKKRRAAAPKKKRATAKRRRYR
jgi:hypothetical protein